MAIEFDSDETIDHFHTPWWKAFHQAVDLNTSASDFISRVEADPSVLEDPAELARWQDQQTLQQQLNQVYAMIGDSRPGGKGKFAIVTGLLGLDTEHAGAQAELHPAYAVAIRVNDDPSDETWAIFVRNWGNEGYCSSLPHPVDFPNNQYTFHLPPNPWVPDESSVSVREEETAVPHE